MQEALTNVAKHARAGRVSVVLSYQKDRLVAIIEDDGRGFEANETTGSPAGGRRLGLLGMEERVAQVGGTLEIESRPGEGTSVIATIPLPGDGGGPVAVKLRVLLADDHPIVRTGLKTLVDAQSDMEVVGEAADGRVAWELAVELRPDVVVMDVSMPELGGAQATERLKQECPDIKVLALTVHEDKGYLRQLLGAGASGYVLKRAAAEELVRAIRAIAAGGLYLDPSVADGVIGGFVRKPPPVDSPGVAN